ncbi:uncharacterized protein EAF02_007338 [Botrytis sinoallii]|uniref:uncharacterized protein n=1 Tax=Botrytis sinoallii TaxID=1463999 RepID=UPI0019021E64|nr:uncharacterized protein EAF02_007338 [Botrytis sinoallii]KAF7880492.1 hypothetical protein EAF02_007338 [Botrytis sinoallii]
MPVYGCLFPVPVPVPVKLVYEFSTTTSSLPSTHNLQRAGQQYSRQQSPSRKNAHLEKMLFPQDQTTISFPNQQSSWHQNRESSIKAKTVTKRSHNPFYYSF